MAEVPTFTADASIGVTRGPRAGATGLAGSLAQAGGELQRIGATLNEFRDRNDLVNAQLDFEEGLVGINKQFEGDTGFGDIRERRESAVNDLISQVTENLSENARAEANTEFREFLIKDGVAFDAQATKSEGEYRVALFESKKNTLMNSYIYAQTDEEKEEALNKMNTGLDSIAPFVPVDKMAEYREAFINDANFLRYSTLIPAMARSGERFDPKTYVDLDPGQVVKLKNLYNSTLTDIRSEAKAFYNERIADHNAILMGTGDNDGLAMELERMGAPDLAKQVRDNDTINMVVYDAVSEAAASSAEMSIAEKYQKAREKLTFGVGDTLAAEKQQALNSLNTSAAKEMAAFRADPAAFVMRNAPVREGETPAMYTDRVTNLQKVAAGDRFFPAQPLSQGQADDFSNRFTLAINSGDSEMVVGLLNEVAQFGPRFEHQILSQVKVPGGIHIAMDANDGKAVMISSLSAIKSPKDIDAGYVELANVSEIMSEPYIQMLKERIEYDPNPTLIQYQNELVNLAHKWLASGRDLDNLFDHYNVADSDRGTVILSSGIDDDDFDDNMERYMENVDFSLYVSDGNPYKMNIIEKLRDDAQIANAPSSDDRLEPGQTGFYVINPMTGTALRNMMDGTPLLVTQDDIMGYVRRTVIPPRGM